MLLVAGPLPPVEVDVGDDAGEPGGEIGLAPEQVDRLKDAHQGVDADVIGLVVVAAEPVRKIIDALFVGADQRIECRAVAALASLYEDLFVAIYHEDTQALRKK